MTEKTGKEELRELARGLRRRVEFGDVEWSAGSARASERAAAPGEALAAAPGGVGAALEGLASQVEACRKCPLGSRRLRAVFGVGSSAAEVVFVGEGPGFEEDHRGEPFVGRSGQLLDRILESIGLSRKTVYIANIVKCHPMVDASDPEKRGNDRPPAPEEIAACRGYLDRQLSLIAPRVIVTLGAVAARVLLGPGEPITRIRGRWRQYAPEGLGRALKLLPTFHPAALLRNPALKKDVWTDMKALREELAQSAPE